MHLIKKPWLVQWSVMLHSLFIQIKEEPRNITTYSMEQRDLGKRGQTAKPTENEAFQQFQAGGSSMTLQIHFYKRSKQYSSVQFTVEEYEILLRHNGTSKSLDGQSRGKLIL